MSTLLVTRIGPGASIQDFGRPGHMHEGVPPGGALSQPLLATANAALGNDESAAGLELPLHGARLTAKSALTVSLDGEVHSLSAGEELRVEPASYAVRYLAVPGGFEVPLMLGARSTLALAGLGRFLKKGDRLTAARSLADAASSRPPPAPDDAPIRLVLGPDAFDDAAVDALFATTFTVSRLGDRTGQRLDGAKLPSPPRDRGYSTPMVRGALQVTTDGTVIVLGPDHPTTGGYPVIAVVRSEDVGRLALRRPGQPVRFGR